MADKRSNNGGRRQGAGRKPKADEVALIERLGPLDDAAFAALEEGIEAREFPYIKMFFEYRFGKPNEKVDVTTKGESLNGGIENLSNDEKLQLLRLRQKMRADA